MQLTGNYFWPTIDGKRSVLSGMPRKRQSECCQRLSAIIPIRKATQTALMRHSR
jgi:hypothetical protein